MDGDSQVYSASLPRRKDNPDETEVPVAKIFVKNQIDIKTAQAWLLNDEKIKNEVIKTHIGLLHTLVVVGSFYTPKQKKPKETISS